MQSVGRHYCLESVCRMGILSWSSHQMDKYLTDRDQEKVEWMFESSEVPVFICYCLKISSNERQS